MRYERREDLPIALQRTLPFAAQEIYRQEYNDIWSIYQHTYHEAGAASAEEIAHRKAWGKIKRHFTKDCDGVWHVRNDATYIEEKQPMKTDIAEKRVAILVDNYFEEAEFVEPLKALKDAGARVTVIGASGKDLQAMDHVALSTQYQADVSLDDADIDEYDALVLPGGVVNADHLRMNEIAQAWVRSFLEDGKPIAAICHAPWLLVSADEVDGRNLTSFYTLQDDIRNAGGEWEDSEVVIDENLITSRKPDDLPAFNKAIIDMLQQQHDDELNEEV